MISNPLERARALIGFKSYKENIIVSATTSLAQNTLDDKADIANPAIRR
jgi:hypothetical protein